MRRALLGVLLIALPFVPTVLAQSPAFEVASIKPHPDTAGGPFLILPGGRVQAESVNLKTLVQRVYRLHAFQVIGPDWMTTDRFDIDANPSDEAMKASSTSEEVAKVLMMLRTLIVERFSLRTHTEMRLLQAYALQFARADRRLGSGIRPSALDCNISERVEPQGVLRTAPATGPHCGGLRFEFKGEVVTLRPAVGTMFQLADMLTPYVDRPIIDRTSLTGNFAVEVSFRPDRGAPVFGQPIPGADAPSIFSAVQEQLGLTLEPVQAQVEVLMIDHVEHPTEN
jgi:uncharacterized protein (TIGR03435 family)